MKLAVFGGTFNPLHIGHAMLADTIITELGYDKILFVPTFITPHKNIAEALQAISALKWFALFVQAKVMAILKQKPVSLTEAAFLILQTHWSF